MDWSITPLLLLSLVAGYVFIQHYEVSRYKIVREDGHKLYFRAAFWGIPVTVVTLILLALAAAAVMYCTSPQGSPALSHHFTFAVNALLIVGLLLSPIMALVYAKILNKFSDRDKHFHEALKENEFEMLLVTSIYRGMLIMVTMEDGKVYVGFVYKTGDPAKNDRAYFSIFPIMSGYRNEQGKVEFTTYYEPIYETQNDLLPELKIEDFALILPVSRLVSARLFDKTAYTQFWQSSDQFADNQ